MKNNISKLLHDRNKITALKSKILDTLPVGYTITDMVTTKYLEVNELFASWCDYESSLKMSGVSFYDLLIESEHDEIGEVVNINMGFESNDDLIQEIYTTFKTPKNNLVTFKWYNYVEGDIAIGACFLISKHPA